MFNSLNVSRCEWMTLNGWHQMDDYSERETIVNKYQQGREKVCFVGICYYKTKRLNWFPGQRQHWSMGGS